MTGPSDPTAAAEAGRLEEMRDKIEFKIERMKPERVKLDTIDMMKKHLDAVQELTEEYGLGVKAFLRKYPSCEEPFKLQLQSDRSSTLTTVETWENEVCAKIYNLQKSNTARVVQPGSNGASATQGQLSTDQSHVVAASITAGAIVAKAVVKYTHLLELAVATTQDMEEDGLYLDSVGDDKISKLMQKTPKYEKTKDKIKSLYSEYLEFTAVHKPDIITHCPTKLSKAVYDANSAIDNLIVDLEKQDEERGLATGLPRKMEKVKWPTFCGKPGESFFKFKEQFLKAAKQNMTSRADQFTKLRENLKDFPLTLVPETMNSVNDAFKRLSDTYGDPQKLVNFELNKLEKVDMFPNCGDGSYTVGTRAQAEWLLSMETVISELINMTTDDDADLDLKRSVLGPQTTSIVLNKFPLVLKHQLISSAKANQPTEKLESFLQKIKEWSKQALDLEKYEPEVKTAPKKLVQHTQLLTDPQAHLFNPPRPMPDCQICVELQRDQHVSPQMCHLSPIPTGCPMFIEMNIVNRNTLCNSLNLCKSCLREATPGHEKSCIVTKMKLKNKDKVKNKYEFTCKDKSC